MNEENDELKSLRKANKELKDELLKDLDNIQICVTKEDASTVLSLTELVEEICIRLKEVWEKRINVEDRLISGIMKVCNAYELRFKEVERVSSRAKDSMMENYAFYQNIISELTSRIVLLEKRNGILIDPVEASILRGREMGKKIYGGI